MKIKSILCVVVIAVLSFASCKSNSTSTNSTNNSGGGSVPSTPNTIAFTADGTAYSLTGSGTKQTFSGQTNLTVFGFDLTGRSLQITTNNITATGTFDVGKFMVSGSSQQIISMTYGYLGSSGDTVVYMTSQTGLTSAGKMTITDNTASSFKSSFDVTLSKIQGSSGAATVHLVGGANVTVQ